MRNWTEQNYIDLTNLTKLRVAKHVLGDVLAYPEDGAVDPRLLSVSARIVGRLIITLASALDE